MAHDGHIDHPQQWNGDVRHDGGQGYLQNLAISDIHIDCKVNDFFGTNQKFVYLCTLI